MNPGFSNFATRLKAFMAFSLKESDPSGALGAVFNDLALELFALQFAANGPYQKFCEARGVEPTAVAHWKEVPAMPTAAFKDFELTALTADERTYVFHSSGTTEQRPSRHFHCAESLAVYEASLWPWFQENLKPTPKTQLIILTPPPSRAPHSSLVHMCDVVRRELRAGEEVFAGEVAPDGSWVIKLEATLNLLRRSESPILILGTAFSFVHLVDALAQQNLTLKLPAGSRMMETGGYKGRSRTLPKAELHSLISKYLGIPRAQIICEYGMSELSSQAYDTKSTLFVRDPRVFQFPPWAQVQIISPETGLEVRPGETGLLRICDLANVYSVLAIQTEDLAVRKRDGFELLGRAELSEARGCSLMAQ